MRAKSRFGLKQKERDSYLEWVLTFPLVSIRSEAHLLEAQQVIDRLLALPRLRKGEEAYLDALSDLVAAYEDEHHVIEPASDADMLRHLLEAKGFTQVQLSRATNTPKSTISEILSGKRNLSRQLIRKFATFFQLDAGILAASLK